MTHEHEYAEKGGDYGGGEAAGGPCYRGDMGDVFIYPGVPFSRADEVPRFARFDQI